MPQRLAGVRLVRLDEGLAQGCEDAMALWREMQGQGCAHGPKMTQKGATENRTRPARRTTRKWLPKAPASAAPGTASGPGPALAQAACLAAVHPEAHACGVSAVETFAAGLEQDGAAVRAAFTEPWSSGQAEGRVSRLKLLKRQSHGRDGFDLPRRRVLGAA